MLFTKGDVNYIVFVITWQSSASVCGVLIKSEQMVEWCNYSDNASIIGGAHYFVRPIFLLGAYDRTRIIFAINRVRCDIPIIIFDL